MSERYLPQRRQFKLDTCSLPASASGDEAARALQRHCTKKSKQLFPEMKLRGLVPNFHIHVSVSDLYIPTIGPPILLRKYGTVVGIYIV
jgi:hypothetical protein